MELSPPVGTTVADRYVVEREIRITAGLQHPHIVPVLDSGEAGGLPFYTMPFVEDGTLARRLRRERPLPVDLALRVAGEVAGALDCAHARGFVHHDVKPENVIRARAHGHARLADFGVARAVDGAGAPPGPAAKRITESGVSVGTVLYMSPEQGTGDAVDGRSDVYALGCVLDEMPSGRPPFAGVSARAILARHLTDPPPRPRAAPTLPATPNA